MKNEMDFMQPVLTDNRNMRKDVREVDAYFKEIRKELESFPKENNLIVDPEIVEFVSCPVCGGSNNRHEYVKYGFIYARCLGCNHLFVQNRLREKVLLGLYAESKADQIARKVSTSAAHLDYWGKVHRKYLAYVDQNPSENRNLLDVGCGAGTFAKCKGPYRYGFARA